MQIRGSCKPFRRPSATVAFWIRRRGGGSVMPGGECRNFSWWPRTIPFQTCVGIEYLQELTFVDSEGEGEGQELSVMGGSGESEDEGEDGGKPTEGELV